MVNFSLKKNPDPKISHYIVYCKYEYLFLSMAFQFGTLKEEGFTPYGYVT